MNNYMLYFMSNNVYISIFNIQYKYNFVYTYQYSSFKNVKFNKTKTSHLKIISYHQIVFCCKRNETYKFLSLSNPDKTPAPATPLTTFTPAPLNKAL